MKMNKSLRALVGVLIGAALLLFAMIQLVPYGRNHSNPPVVREPNWDAQTRAIAKRACFDCHSNETVWTWYSNIAPLSWLIQRDVDEGRRSLNFSEWGKGETEEIGETVAEGEMPPTQYLLLHPNAKLTNSEKQLFFQAFGRE